MFLYIYKKIILFVLQTICVTWLRSKSTKRNCCNVNWKRSGKSSKW
jgi:hypothetical protein